MTKKKITQYLKKYFISLLIFVVFSGFFVIIDLFNKDVLSDDGHLIELYANQNGDDLAKLFTTAIDQAKSSILLIVYSLTDREIIASLQNQYHQGITVKIICDAEATPHFSTKLGMSIPILRRFGDGLMHQKILVIDKEQVFVGSANMTRESLHVHGNLVAKIDSEALALKMWNQANAFKQKGKGSASLSSEYQIAGQSVEMWFLPDSSEALLRIKSLIRSAKKTIRVAMFTWTRHDLAHEIIKAKNRGVDVEVAIDHNSAKGVGSKVVELLHSSGIPVYISRGGPLLHHKFLYIDQSILVNGSANWTKRAFSQNDDCFMVIHDLTNQQIKCMDKLWNIITNEAKQI